MKKAKGDIIIMDWMITELGLSGNRLLIYAVIYDYSKDGGDYSSGYKLLGRIIGAHINTAIRITKELVDKGFLVKEDEAVGGNIIPHFRVTRRG